MKKLIFVMANLLLCLPVSVMAAQSDSFQMLQARQKSEFNATTSRLADDWDALEKKQQQEWAELRRQIARKWQSVALPSQKEWVDYDNKFETRSKVDFAEGNIQVETIVGQEEAINTEKALANIIAKIKDIFSEIVAGGAQLLDGQVKNGNGQVVTPENIDEFIEQNIVPQVKRQKAYTAADGVRRQEFSVQVQLVPDHLTLRAEKYKPLVLQAANKLKLDPKLLMAIIHTESAFNPLAVSPAGAVGLMQVIPRYAGREAYQYLYDNDWLILPAYLAAPGINIELGSTYYSLLNNRYFGKFETPKKMYLAICAYNWGPTAIQKNIVDKYRITEISAPALYEVLKENTPAETSAYLEKVTSRISLYHKYF